MNRLVLLAQSEYFNNEREKCFSCAKNTRTAIILINIYYEFGAVETEINVHIIWKAKHVSLFVIANIDEHLNRTHTFYEDYIQMYIILNIFSN